MPEWMCREANVMPYHENVDWEDIPDIPVWVAGMGEIFSYL